MPFTVSHVVAVLPLRGRAGLRTLPLVLGAMVPDVAMILDQPGYYSLTHSLIGIVSVDVALAALLAALWVWWAGEPVLAALPGVARARLPARPARSLPGSPAAVAWWTASAALGAATHVVLDLFTHEDRARNISPVLEEQIGRWTVAHWAQYVLGALGLLVLTLYAARWLARAPVRTRPLPPRPASWPWVASGILAVSVVGLALARAAHQADSYTGGVRFTYQYAQLAQHAAFGFLAGVLLALVVLGGLWRLRRPQGRVEGPPGRVPEQDETDQVEGTQVR